MADRAAATSTHLTVCSSSRTLSFAPCLSRLTFSSAALKRFMSSLSLPSQFSSASVVFALASAYFDSTFWSWAWVAASLFSAADARAARVWIL